MRVKVFLMQLTEIWFPNRVNYFCIDNVDPHQYVGEANAANEMPSSSIFGNISFETDHQIITEFSSICSTHH